MLLRPLQIGDLLLPEATELTSEQNGGQGTMEYALKDGAFVFANKPRLNSKQINISGVVIEENYQYLCNPCVQYTFKEFGRELQKIRYATTTLLAVRQDNRYFQIKVWVDLPKIDQERQFIDGFYFNIPVIAYDPYWRDVTEFLFLNEEISLCPCSPIERYIPDATFSSSAPLCQRLRVIEDYQLSLSDQTTGQQIEKIIFGKTDAVNNPVQFLLAKDFYFLTGGFSLQSNVLQLTGTFTFDTVDTYQNFTSIVLTGTSALQDLTIYIGADISRHADNSPVFFLDSILSNLKIIGKDNLARLRLRLYSSETDYLEIDNLQDFLTITDSTWQEHLIRFNNFTGLGSFNYQSLQKIVVSYRGTGAIIKLGAYKLVKNFGSTLNQVVDTALVGSTLPYFEVEAIAFFAADSTKRLLAVGKNTIIVPNNYQMAVVANGKYYFGNSFYSLREIDVLNNRFDREVSVSYESDQSVSLFYRTIELYY